MVHDEVVWLKDINLKDIEQVGGKNASLGEMIQNLTTQGILVPDGFVTTTQAFRTFLGQLGLDQKIYSLLNNLNSENVQALTEVGKQIRDLILETPIPTSLEQAITANYQALQKKALGKNPSELTVAVRSSATAEDLPEASFAGQQETLLNVVGIEAILKAVKQVFASLFTDRAIAYRVHHHFPHEQVALSVCIQHMVRSDKAASGVMFTLDTESGFDEVVLITSNYGLGELVVQGAVNPDEFYVYKPSLLNQKRSIIRKNLGKKQFKMVFEKQATQTLPVSDAEQNQFSLTDAEIEALSKQALLIEKHYGCPMDIEWAKDGLTEQLFIVQARPETVKSRVSAQTLERYVLSSSGKVLVEGRSVGQRIGQGKAVVIDHIRDMDKVAPGDVLVTDMTDPDWEPIMKRAKAIVTNRGGRTCHAAIVARELGIPAVVGCHHATTSIQTGQPITVSCAQGDIGYVYEGLLNFDIKRAIVNDMPVLPFKMMMNIGNPERAFDFRSIPNAGVGLARLEFIIGQSLGVHPKACLEFASLSKELQQVIQTRSAGYDSPQSFFVEKLTEGIATLGAAFWPNPVIVRLSDFKSNEYANLIGGASFEPTEENPMLGFRGAARYLSSEFQACFALECTALKAVREEFGLTNIQIMVPFVRTPKELKAIIDLLEAKGLKRGDKGLKIIMMCEIPANAILADSFLEYVDGFSIGSNDLTQLTLGLDRDSEWVAGLFDERNEAVLQLLHQAIKTCRAKGKTIGICGQGPSDHPDFAQWLMREGIDSMSLNPDSVLSTWEYLTRLKG